MKILSLANKIVFVFCLVITIIFLCSCSKEEQVNQNLETNTVDYCTTANVAEMDFEYSDRDISAKYDDHVVNVNLNGNFASSDDEGVDIEGSKIKINSSGTYIFKGNLNDGQIYVSGEDAKVQIVLDNVNIHSETSSAIYFEEVKKGFITLAEGSTNTLSDNANIYSRENFNAVVFSKDDLCINGCGTLIINANYKHAIDCNDDLTITEGNYQITSAKDGIRANDSIKILDGSFNINSIGDCIIAANKNSEKNGYIAIDGGNYKLESQDSCIKACTYLRLNDGDFQVNSVVDSFHSNVKMDINGGSYIVSSQDDAFKSENDLTINDGNINIESSYEGIEAQIITINDGNISVISSDDPVNASYAEWNSINLNNEIEKEGINKTDPDVQRKIQHNDIDILKGDPFGGQVPGPNGWQKPDFYGQNGQNLAPQDDGAQPFSMNMGNGECKIIINNGYLYTDAYGDGIDSNGDIEINGGTVLINGPVSGGDSPVDYGEQGSCTINGGKFIAIGSIGMFENFTGGTQPFGYINASGNAGSDIVIKTKSNEVLNQLTATKSFQIIICSDTSFVDGDNYIVNVNGIGYTLTASRTPKTFTPEFSGAPYMYGLEDQNRQKFYGQTF